jgi:Amt family ammonium transporter
MMKPLIAVTTLGVCTPLFADDATAIEQLQLNMDILWTCIAAFLVFLMQAGFALVESGFTRAKNACNIIMKNLLDFSMGSIAWWIVGFGLMFGTGGAWVGSSHFAASDYGEGLNHSFFIFQCVFAGTAATIVSGAMAERTKFTSYIVFSICIVAFIYPISGHWYWASLFGQSEGLFEKQGFMDFAGSTVVHSCGAWLALAGAMILGPRLGKYGPKGSSRAIPGHHMPLASLGVFILWFGWFGFNPGSTTAANSSIGYIAMTTNLAAAAGTLGAMFTCWIRYKKPDTGMTLNGVLAGLVSITAGCDSVTPLGAVIIGLLAGVLVVISVEVIDHVFKIDDPVGAVSVHGVCGFWGTLALVFFQKEPLESIGAQFLVQLLGALAMFVWAFGMGLILFSVIRKVMGLRVSREEELKGLDMSEHGNDAYAGFHTSIL